MITKHPIYQDFPEYADKIKDLYHNNDEFQVLLHSYTDLDEKIYKIERDEELAMDDELSHLRKDRVFLKDEIFNFLKGSYTLFKPTPTKNRLKAVFFISIITLTDKHKWFWAIELF